MTPAEITTRASVLAARADACAAGFTRLGHRFAAELTSEFAQACRTMPEMSDLYIDWIEGQEKRLVAKGQQQ